MAGGTPCGRRTGPPPPKAGSGRTPTSTPPTGSTPGSRTPSAPAGRPAWTTSRPLTTQVNAAWLTAAMTGQILLAWLKLLALDGDLAEAEPRTLRYRVLHTAARLVRGGRRRRLKIQASWPWAPAITAAWQRIDALPQAP